MSYIAVIFDPLKERPQTEFVGGLGGYNFKPPVFVFSVQIPENGKLLTATTQAGKGGKVDDIYAIQKFDNVFFRPGSNLNIDSVKWGFCKQYAGVEFRLKVGALEVIEPTQEALELNSNDIGYHMYSTENALRLVKCTNDLDSLKEWSDKEVRKEVLNAAEAQYKAIEKHLIALKDG